MFTIFSQQILSEIYITFQLLCLLLLTKKKPKSNPYLHEKTTLT